MTVTAVFIVLNPNKDIILVSSCTFKTQIFGSGSRSVFRKCSSGFTLHIGEPYWTTPRSPISPKQNLIASSAATVPGSRLGADREMSIPMQVHKLCIPFGFIYG